MRIVVNNGNCKYQCRTAFTHFLHKPYQNDIKECNEAVSKDKMDEYLTKNGTGNLPIRVFAEAHMVQN